MSEENKVPAWQDLNHNGVPDFQEGWFWRALWFAAKVVAAIVPQHTTYARVIGAADRKLSELN